MYSLHKRLILSLAGSLILFFVAQTLMIGREVESLSEQSMISRLSHDQDALLAALNWQPPALPKLDPDRIPEIYRRPFSGHYYQITIADTVFHSRSLWDEQLPYVSAPIARDVSGPLDQKLLLLSQTVNLHGQTVRISTAEDISHIEQATAAFQRHLLLFALAAVVVLLVLQGWLIRNGLKPLQRIRSQLSQLEKGEVDRISMVSPSEIMPLVDEINRLVLLIRIRLDRSRHALGDLAHALKTPLSVIGQVVQRQSSSQEAIQVKQQLDQIGQRIDRELSRARTAGYTPGGSWADPERDLGDLTAVLKQVFPGIRIKTDIAPGLIAAADREDMLEVFGNLLENACKWSSSLVYCRISKEQQCLYISVEDDGPGIDADQYHTLLMRGARLDESKPGHGLGLSIVSEIVVAYEGTISLNRSPDLQGLMVTITLPQR